MMKGERKKRMDHSEILAMCRELVANTLGISEDEIPVIPWDSFIDDFAAEYSFKGLSVQQIEAEFTKQVEEWLQKQQRLKESAGSASQRHHDYYVRLHREGKLSHPDDEANYKLAIHREEAGLVAPLPE